MMNVGKHGVAVRLLRGGVKHNVSCQPSVQASYCKRRAYAHSLCTTNHCIRANAKLKEYKSNEIKFQNVRWRNMSLH